MNRRNFNIEFPFFSSATNLWIIRRAVGICGLEYYRSVTTSWWYFAPRESFLILRGVQVCKLSGSRRTIWSKIFSAHTHGDRRFETRLQINNLEIQFCKWWKTYALAFWIDDEIDGLECEINFGIANKGNIYYQIFLLKRKMYRFTTWIISWIYKILLQDNMYKIIYILLKFY